jgi:hypothetical protein
MMSGLETTEEQSTPESTFLLMKTKTILSSMITVSMSLESMMLQLRLISLGNKLGKIRLAILGTLKALLKCSRR